MSYTSTVPAAITALLATFAAAPALAGVEVRDGPQTPGTSADEAVYVGFTGDDSDDAWTSQETPEGQGGGRNREKYSVHCSAMVLNQDGDLAAARNRAFTLRAAAGAALAVNSKLGGLVMQATFSAGSGRQMQTVNGVKVYVLFDADCDAYTTQ